MEHVTKDNNVLSMCSLVPALTNQIGKKAPLDLFDFHKKAPVVWRSAFTLHSIERCIESPNSDHLRSKSKPDRDSSRLSHLWTTQIAPHSPGVFVRGRPLCVLFGVLTGRSKINSRRLRAQTGVLQYKGTFIDHENQQHSRLRFFLSASFCQHPTTDDSGAGTTSSEQIRWMLTIYWTLLLFTSWTNQIQIKQKPPGIRLVLKQLPTTHPCT